MSEIKNYKIISTHLGYEAHGIFTFYLRLKGADGIRGSVGMEIKEVLDKVFNEYLKILSILKGDTE